VHTGVSCEVATTVGGHFFIGDPATDPWTTTWTSNDGGLTAMGTFDITTPGLPLATWADHAVVVHDTGATGGSGGSGGGTGARVGCGVIKGPVSTNSNVGVYPGYAGTNTVDGWVSIANTGVAGEMIFAYSLTGLNGPSGGIHVHEGTSCATTTDPGDHYWFPAASTDPWNSADTPWTSANNVTAVGFFKVQAGLSADNANSHVVVAHAPDGTRMACGVLSKTTDGVAHSAIGAYPGSTNAAKARGLVEVSESGTPGTLTVDYWLWVSETTATGGLNSPQGGLHIHKGVSCNEASLVGAHYWNAAITTDPWNAATRYGLGTAMADNGYVTGTFDVPDNYPLAANIGHSVVVHAGNTTQNNPRIGCGTLKGDNYYQSHFSANYPGTTPTETIRGHFIASKDATDPNLVHYSYALTSSEAEGSEGGLHVHAGLYCAAPNGAALAGPHYYSGATDPWTTKYAPVDANGASWGYFALDDGYSFDDHKNRATVAHFADGARATCGNFDGPAPEPATNPATDAPTNPATDPPTDPATDAPKKGDISSAGVVSAALFAVVASYFSL
jgi:Cu/Zn superoxide dismutase